MQEYTFRDELLNLPEAKKYQLSIQISLDGFVVFIHEGESIRLFHLATGTLSNYRMVMRKLDLFLTAQQLSGLEFERVTSILATKVLEVIPNYPASSESIVGWFTQERTNGRERVVQNTLTDNYSLLFSVPNEIEELLHNHFPKIEWVHLLEHLVAHDVKELQNSDTVKCHIHSNCFFVRIYRNQKIELLNVYDCHNGSELIYFLLSAIKAAGCVNPLLSYTGQLNLSDAEWRQVKRTIGKLDRETQVLPEQLSNAMPSTLAEMIVWI